jgi:large subunit ribosomal protein L40e
MPFPEAQKRLLDKKICMRCYSRNPPDARTCRKCHYTGLRVKSKEVKAKA